MSSNLMPGVDRSTIVKVVAIWLIISGILGLCGGLALLGIGALGGVLGAGTAAIIGEAGADAAEAAAAGAELAAASGFALILGIIFIILAPASLVVAWALFNRRSWARMGVVILAGISAIGALLSIITGGGGVGGNIVQLVINAFVAYFFYTDSGIQQTLSN